MVLARRFRRGEKGSAAIEFAMVAPMFFALLLGIMQAGIIFFAQETLQNAVFDIGRMIRTGENQCFTTDSNGICQAMTQDDFRNQVCAKVSALMSCTASLNGASLLQFDVKAYPAGFAGATNGSPLVDNDLPPLNTFDPGSACNVVLIRVFYKWPIQAPGLNWFLTNMANHSHLLAAATAFRNEPYGAVAGC
jgi:Flp pilus assembly protein TadG